jgi:DNA-binding PadR family transcriptional regulator
MSLAHAILGFLRQQPNTGYDLKTEQFDASVAHFWRADQAQIYRTLDKLAEQDWVESRIEIQTDRPNRKIYAITAAGEAELRRWLEEVQELPIHREPFLVQLFFAGQLDDQAIIRQMQAQLAQHEAVLQRYQEIHIPVDCPTPEERRAARLQQMTLDFGIRAEQTYIQWLKDCIEPMRRGL